MKDRKILVLFILVFSTMLSSFAFYFYQVLFTPNLQLEREDVKVLIPYEADFKYVQNMLYDQRIVNDLVAFSFLAKLMDYPELVKPGVYTIRKDMSNLEAIRLLRAGDQSPIRITFNNIRTLEELPAVITQSIGVEEDVFADLLLSDSVALAYGFTPETFIAMFLPNTYELYWTISAEELLDRMKREYDRFWLGSRTEKAAAIGLTPLQVTVLASIVQAETNQISEAPTVAGVYLNRIERKIPLQADPTLVFAAGDFTIKRVLNKHKEIDSPYNTYKYAGLPPGPINMPQTNYIDAVLNFEEHKYLYFCAKEDFSGFHVFAKTLAEHNQNARRYQQALNKAGLFK